MNRVSAKFLCQVYLLVLLLSATVFSGSPYSLFSLFLLAAALATVLHPLPPRFDILIYVTTILLLPPILAAMLEGLTGLTGLPAHIVPAVSIFPVIYLLDRGLRQNAFRTLPSPSAETGRKVSTTSRVLFSAVLAALLIGLLLDAPTLLVTGIALALYLLAMLIWLSLTLPPAPLKPEPVRQRVVAGTAADVSLGITGQASEDAYCHIVPADRWVKAAPQKFLLRRGTSRINLEFTPPLAGAAYPVLRAAVTDQRGLVQVYQELSPVHLQVIPRARYAEWLATKYLTQGEAGASPAAPSKEIARARKGIDYRESRAYQPGDSLKDIDWKHTMKLRQLIINEFSESGEQATIIAVNLSVTGAEEADRLAFNLITSALTLARESIPCALAAYDQEKVILTTKATDPGEILKRTLALVKDISIAGPTRQYLEMPDIARLRRNIDHLRIIDSAPAHRLLELLHFEQRAIRETAQNHPATLALIRVTRQVPSPAMILLISQLTHDAEAVLVNSERLSRRRYTTVPLQVTA